MALCHLTARQQRPPICLKMLGRVAHYESVLIQLKAYHIVYQSRNSLPPPPLHALPWTLEAPALVQLHPTVCTSSPPAELKLLCWPKGLPAARRYHHPPQCLHMPRLPVDWSLCLRQLLQLRQYHNRAPLGQRRRLQPGSPPLLQRLAAPPIPASSSPCRHSPIPCQCLPPR